MTDREFITVTDGLCVHPRWRPSLAQAGLTGPDAVFAFHDAEDLSKPGLAGYRSRLRFELGDPPVTVYLKRYDRPPVSVQIRNWMTLRRRRACALAELEPTLELARKGIGTPEIIAYGVQWAALFERRSFIISRAIPHADALERRLPPCFSAPATPQTLIERRAFITRLADFVRRFHATGYRHRDLYLSHIFCADDGTLSLIDLARAFKPGIAAERFRRKDIAELHYSAPGAIFSRTDRLRFYRAYAETNRLGAADKTFIRRIAAKARRIARHDAKRNRPAPFLEPPAEDRTP